MIEAAELIERGEAERTGANVVFHRCVVAGVLGVSPSAGNVRDADHREGGRGAHGVVVAQTLQNEGVLAAGGQRAERRMAETGVSLGVEQLPGATRIAVCGLLIKRGRVVLNQRLRPVSPLQGEGIKAVLELEDERPVRSDGLHALDAEMRLSKPVRHDRIERLIARLLDERFNPVGIIAIERDAVRLIAGAVVEPSVERDAVPGERAIVGTRRQEVIEAREAWLAAGAAGWAGAGCWRAGRPRPRPMSRTRPRRKA